MVLATFLLMTEVNIEIKNLLLEHVLYIKYLVKLGKNYTKV